MACRLMGTERQVPAARELALKIKLPLREQVGECLTCSIDIAPVIAATKDGFRALTRWLRPFEITDVSLTLPAQQCSMFRHVVTLWPKLLDRLNYVTILALLRVLDRAAGPLAETVTDRMMKQQAQRLRRMFPAVDFDHPNRLIR